MKLSVTVPTRSAPDDPDVLALVDGLIAARASAWTVPVYDGEQTSPTGRRLLRYLTDATPRAD